jgi:hypothetical protein
MFQHTGVRCQSGCVGMELVKWKHAAYAVHMVAVAEASKH